MEEQFLLHSSAGRLSGVGLYVAGSGALAAFVNGLGISFSAAVATSLSSAMAVVFGPLGIGAASVVTVFQITRARPKLAIPFVLYMGVMRGQLEMASEKKLTFREKFLRLVQNIHA